LISAPDSVYAFQVASDPATPISKRVIDQTASYTTVDDTTIEWVGKPGLVTDTFESYFWAPMPEHVWGKYSADELLEAEEVNRNPLGWGAYAVEEWQPGAYIRLRKNPFYFRTDEGLPVFDHLTFKITNPNGDTNISNLKFDRSPFEYFNLDIGEFNQEIEENGCDLISSTANMRDQLSILNILTNYYQDPSVVIHKLQTGDQDVLFFNLRESYDSFEPGLDKKANPLSSKDVRKAIGFCLDHERVNSSVYYGQPDPPRIWVEASADKIDQTASTFNSETGIELLEESGWMDHDEDKNTGRISSSVENIPNGTSLTFSYLTVDTLNNRSAAYIYKESLAECGIDIIIKSVPPEIFWDPSTEMSIFKGKFNLAQVEWTTPINNPCPLVISTNIPGESNGFAGINFSAYTSSLIDKECATFSETTLKEEKEQTLENILRIISEEVPFLPLNTHPKFIVSRNDLCEINDKINSAFSAIEGFVFETPCSN
ncbi:MAG: ABC transporter substrate-binding protein, partial [Pelolinea sp.]|nr:ABC transporter substrate-binding protein [Pelolinea sp.]